MITKVQRKEIRYTEPDHRPMIPVFRQPGDMMDAAVRELRSRYDELDPARHMRWR